MRKFFLIFILIIFIFLNIFLITTRSRPKESKIKVGTSIFPIFLATKAIANDKIEIIWLTEKQSLHEITFKPEMISNVVGAKIIFTTGLDIDLWAEEMAEKLNIPVTRVAIKSPTFIEKSGYINPHFFLSFEGFQGMLEVIVSNLKTLDPQNGNFFQNNYENLVREIQSLKNEYTKKFAEVKEVPFFTYHDAFLPLFREFNLNFKGSLKIADRELNPNDLISLAKLSKQFNIRLIFNDETSETPLLRNFAQELNLKIVNLNPLESGKIESNLLKEWKTNLETIYQQLKIFKK